uniref:Uncharacterized protein n=1 Tax=Physcomitrium patens TaxID=3218 RepID=A0A2K1K7F3_PHYPA|nr:hypothetical protein PHYPA_011598 [Physcomitrium patens]
MGAFRLFLFYPDELLSLGRGLGLLLGSDPLVFEVSRSGVGLISLELSECVGLLRGLFPSLLLLSGQFLA